MNLATPALLFPAISLLLLAYTNRFLTLAQVIRQLHASPGRDSALVKRQIPGLKRRIVLIQYMQSFGVLSFLLCALAMLALFMHAGLTGQALFGISIVSLAISLVLSLLEVLISTNALAIVVEDFERQSRPPGGEGEFSGKTVPGNNECPRPPQA
ncbi:MAG: DUF2721 domain-containing protein [Azoarcus sp.]|jgi:hypothetical protein|nr:DUF2721 domain-containing protein [Azoarcus sp.]